MAKIKLAQIPSTSVADEVLRPVIDTMRDILRTRAHGEERWITMYDLVDIGLLNVTKDGAFFPVEGSAPGLPPPTTGGGTTPGTGAPPGVPVGCVYPPTPTNVVGTAMFEGAFIDWDVIPTPYRLRHLEAQVFRAKVNDRSVSQIIGTSPGTSYFDRVKDSGGTYYYWVRFKNECGDIGPFHGIRGISVTIPYTPSYLAGLLTNQITKSQLWIELGAEIEAVEGIVTQVEGLSTSVASLQYTTNTTAGQVTQLSASLHAFDAGIAWRFGETYAEWFGTGWSVTPGAFRHGGQILDEVPDGYLGVRCAGNDAPVVSPPPFNVPSTNNLVRVGVKKLEAVQFIGLMEYQTAAGGTGVWYSKIIGTPLTWRADDTAVVTFDMLNEPNWTLGGYITQIRLKLFQAPSKGSTTTAYMFDWIAVGRVPTSTELVQLEESARVWADPVHGLGGQYTVKIDAGGYVAGFGLSATPNDVVKSNFFVRADRFAVGPAAGPYYSQTRAYAVGATVTYRVGLDMRVFQRTAGDGLAGFIPTDTAYWTPLDAQLPFIVTTTGQQINGVTIPPGVYMSSAFIHEAFIQNAMIGAAAITTAKIADLTVTNAKISTLDAGKITTGFLDANRIQAGSITAGKIDTYGLTIWDNEVPPNPVFTSGVFATINPVHIANKGIFFGLQEALGASVNTPIATYISGLAVTNALIANAAIDTAKIASTLQSTNWHVANKTGWQINKSGTMTLNELVARGTVESGNFSAGSAGWQIQSNGNAEFSNVTVRGSSSVLHGTVSVPARLDITVNNNSVSTGSLPNTSGRIQVAGLECTTGNACITSLTSTDVSVRRDFNDGLQGTVSVWVL